MIPAYIEQVYVDEDAGGRAFTQQILRNLKDIPVRFLRGQGLDERGFDIATGKRTLYLQEYKGDFLKPCPGTREYICCGYQILNLAANCPLNCSYCILQSYFANQPSLRVFANLEENIDQVLNVIDSQPDRIFRVGTGEFTDSLALDPMTRWSDMLLPRFSKQKNAILELKTKTTHIRRLVESAYRDRIVLSWSLNSPRISGREEKGAPGIRRRIAAARQCQSEGYVLGFHFDPLIPHTGWKEDYARTIGWLAEQIEPTGIIWISMGSFRFMPDLKPIVRKRHPASEILNGEFIIGLDGKMRYFKPIRIELYGFVKQLLEEWHPDLGLYFCMESDDVWRSAMGWSPQTSDGLCRYLDQRVATFFG